ncbi:4-alpha-glucanotransferase [Burkholderia gladioli]|uniref:4-alpha-glucanotransferase n=1 Tax=Burkholderia gladioli TaxID=28095 RepID=UPI000F8131D7|nr:4-alpha-glucanotransferase [Burkholderia gladioli]MDD1785888.1 4-alpha-glucanotransferase [Burkholderia gladioli]MDN7814022.1 4-alpha-glucanotransferase [Burkholderia gladioli]
MSAAQASSIAALARAAGLEPDWTDAGGTARRVDDAALAVLLDALGLPCATRADREWSSAALHAPAAAPPLVTADVGAPVPWPGGHDRVGDSYTLTLESGESSQGKLLADAGDAGSGPGLLLPPIATPGYHQVETAATSLTVAVAPARGWTLDDAAHAAGRARPFGLAAQLYGLRRDGDLGLGDTSALATLARSAARLGADALALSPTHAGFPAQPERDSPYSPSSRRWHNLAYVDPDMVLGAEATRAVLAETGLAETAEALSRAPLVDWPRALHLKLRVLRALFERWRAHPSAEHEAFARFSTEGGDALHAQAVFDALQAQAIAERLGPDWRRWPAEWQSPGTTEVRAFAAAHAEHVAFFAFTQWLASRGLDGARQAAREAGMSIGTIADLAVGVAPDGADAWAAPHTLLSGLSIGAPPDLFNPEGQAWGVATWTPAGLRANGYAPFIALLRGAFAHAGGVRIDHILGFQRLWIVRDGGSPREGAYLRYPLDDLLRLVALESARHRAIAIGEDLGTVPEGLRERLAARGIAGMRVLAFERERDGAFRPPEAWDRDAAAMSSTHDLPTLAGWWRGVDLAWRRHVLAGQDRRADEGGPAREAGEAAAASAAFADAMQPDDPEATWPPMENRMIDRASSLAPALQEHAPSPTRPVARDAEVPRDAVEAAGASGASAAPATSAAPLPPDLAAREADRAQLWQALLAAGVVPPNAASQAPPTADAPPVAAALAFVARSASTLALLPLEDLLALPAQPNLPGPPVGHPNWRRRMPRDTARLIDDPAAAALAAIALARRTAGEPR